MARRVERPTLDFGSGHDLTVREFESHVGLCADSAEPACDSVSLSLPSPPPNNQVNKSIDKVNMLRGWIPRGDYLPDPQTPTFPMGLSRSLAYGIRTPCWTRTYTEPSVLPFHRVIQASEVMCCGVWLGAVAGARWFISASLPTYCVAQGRNLTPFGFRGL